MTTTTLGSYFFMLRTFRNGFAMIRNVRRGGYLSHGPAMDRLVLWNGRTIFHPPARAGLVPAMLELWRENAYGIGRFYRPAADDIVVDVGAHIGLFTLHLLRAEPRCRITALEPSPENFACLRQNLSPLLPQAQVRIHQLGIAPEFSRIKMMDLPTNRSFDARCMPASDQDPGSVGAVPLDHLFELAESRAISLLKMDAEGGEYGAFAAAPPQLFHRIDRIVLEYHDNYMPGSLAMLTQKLAPTHHLTVIPDPGQLHGKLFAVRKTAKKPAFP